MQFELLQKELRNFAQERDWEKFHSPKNLAMALTVEASELLEVFQWMGEKDSAELTSEEASRAAQEIADVQIYLARIADVLGIDIELAVKQKLEINREKYPADKVKGSSRKYTSYKED